MEVSNSNVIFAQSAALPVSLKSKVPVRRRQKVSGLGKRQCCSGDETNGRMFVSTFVRLPKQMLPVLSEGSLDRSNSTAYQRCSIRVVGCFLPDRRYARANLLAELIQEYIPAAAARPEIHRTCKTTIYVQ